jgi:glycosyltransferase involved in cell wall biosynthesis
MTPNTQKPLKILLDPQVFYQEFGGISRLFVEVYIRLKQSRDVQIDLPLIYSANGYLKAHQIRPSLASKLLCNRLVSKLALKLMKPETLLGLNWAYMRFKLKTKRYDVVLSTYYDGYFLDLLTPDTRLIVTVFDLIHENYLYREWDVTPILEQKKAMFQAAKGFIAISNNTKMDLLASYPGIKPEEVEVVWLASGLKRPTMPPIGLDLPKRYVLFIGNRDSYKQFKWMVSKIAPWMRQNGVSLVCNGGGRFWDHERDLLEELQIDAWVKHTSFSDDDLAHLYAQAIALIYPSQYEGFGLPVVEAMGCGCPVLVNPNSSLPEVAGDAALYFQYNDNSLPENLDKLLYVPFREMCVQKGFQQSRQFSWDKTAEGYLQVIKGVSV